MTDRVSHLVVALSEDIREDEVQHLVNAIYMLKQVKDVQLGLADPSDFVARVRVYSMVREKLYEVMKTLS